MLYVFKYTNVWLGFMFTNNRTTQEELQNAYGPILSSVLREPKNLDHSVSW